MKKKAYLIHGWGGSSEGGWFDWLKQELEKKGFEVYAFDMPETNEPKIEKWVGYLEEKISPDEIDEHTYFVGHSIGCQAILRYLETLNDDLKVGGAIFVAPWMELDKHTIEEEGEEVIELARPWMETPINFEKIKKHTKNFLAIFSDDDHYISLEEVKKFEKNLNAKTIVKHNEKHFDSTPKIPEILEFIK